MSVERPITNIEDIIFWRMNSVSVTGGLGKDDFFPTAQIAQHQLVYKNLFRELPMEGT